MRSLLLFLTCLLTACVTIDNGDDMHNRGGQQLDTTKANYSSFGKSMPSVLDVTNGKLTTVNGLQILFPVASVFTLQFNVAPPVFPAGPFEFSCEAIVNWVVDANYVQRRVSVINGMTISGVGQGVNVQFVDTSSGFPDGTKYTVTASATPGPRSSFPAFPILTALRATVITAPGLITFPVPQDIGAIAIQVLIGEVAAAQFPAFAAVIMETASGFEIGRYDPTVHTGYIPIMPGTARITIVNLGTQSFTASAVFGIDG